MTLDPMPVYQPGEPRPSWSIPVTFDWPKQKRTNIDGTIVGRCIGADSFDILIDGTAEVASDIQSEDIRPRAAVRAVRKQ